MVKLTGMNVSLKEGNECIDREKEEVKFNFVENEKKRQVCSP